MMRWILINFLLMLTPMVWGQDAVAIAKDIGKVEWTKDDIQAVFLGERSTWPNGRGVVVVLPSSKSDSFEKTAQWAFVTDGFEYQKYWLSQVFQCRANPPIYLEDEDAVMDFVENHPGSIGLLHQVQAPAELRLSLR